VLIDTFHSNIEEKSIPEALLALGPYLKHIHASENDRGVPGRGHVDFPGIVQALRRSILEAWLAVAADTSPETFLFPTVGRGKRLGALVPRDGNNFLRIRIHPIAERLGILKRLVTFQVMRRTLGTDLQRHGTMKDVQRILRHTDINTTGNIYMQEIPSSVREALDARTGAVLGSILSQLPSQTVPNGTPFGDFGAADPI